MSIECKFPTAAEAKKHNLFSRRHQTSAEHQDASDARKQRVLAQYHAAEARVVFQDARRSRWAAEKAAREAQALIHGTL